MAYNTKIPLFRRWVLQNFPFIEQDFDALTDYQLICKVVEYLNKCIETVNASTEQIEILTNAFNQLKDYVDHYFDSLDLQTEVNNKLDAMAEDGTLQALFTGYGLEIGSDNKVKVKAGTGITVDENGVSETPYSDYIKDIDALEYDYENTLTSTKTHINYSIISSDYTPKIVMSDPNDPNVSKRASEFDFEYKPTLMTNLFAWNIDTHTTYGPIVIDGVIKVNNNLDEGTNWKRPIVAIDNKGILHNIDGNTQAQSINYPNAFRAWYCLFNDGQTNPNLDNTEHDPRTFLAQDVNGNWLIGVCGGRKVDDTGMVFSDIIDFINTTLQFNAKLIYSLDGGRSSNFLYHGIRQNKLIGREDRACPNWLVWSSDTAKHEGLFKNQSINNLEYIAKTHDNDGHLLNKDDIIAKYPTGENITINPNSRIFQICPRVINFNINFTVASEGVSAYSHILENLPHTFGNTYFAILNTADGTINPGYLYQGTDSSQLRTRYALSAGTYVINLTTVVDEMY